jgi:hypothetical protein
MLGTGEIEAGRQLGREDDCRRLPDIGDDGCGRLPGIGEDDCRRLPGIGDDDCGRLPGIGEENDDRIHNDVMRRVSFGPFHNGCLNKF